MRTLVPSPPNSAAMAPFGRIFDLDGDGPDVVAEPIEGVRDRYTVEPVVTGAVHVGMTSASVLPRTVARMERHPTTREGLLCIDEPVVVLLSADPAPQPAADSIRAVLVRPGECLSLGHGVWHSEAFGLEGPSRYYWLAGVSDSPESPWAEILGGPVHVTAPGLAPGTDPVP